MDGFNSEKKPFSLGNFNCVCSLLIPLSNRFSIAHLNQILYILESFDMYEPMIRYCSNVLVPFSRMSNQFQSNCNLMGIIWNKTIFPSKLLVRVETPWSREKKISLATRISTICCMKNVLQTCFLPRITSIEPSTQEGMKSYLKNSPDHEIIEFCTLFVIINRKIQKSAWFWILQKCSRLVGNAKAAEFQASAYILHNTFVSLHLYKFIAWYITSV